jgi:hypothetical protein
MCNLMKPLLRLIFLTIIMTFRFKSPGQTIASDTTFLLRESKNGIYHAIYIDSDKTSMYYDRISNFDFTKSELEDYKSSLDNLKKDNPRILSNHIAIEFPKQWCSLHSFKDRFYVYAPSDYISNFRIAFSDSTYIEYFGDGPTGSFIHSFAKTDSKSFQFNLNSFGKSERIIKIHILDEMKGIAVFEENSNYSLMVRADRIRMFPVIINYCKSQKQLEFEFDKINFDRLLSHE